MPKMTLKQRRRLNLANRRRAQLAKFGTPPPNWAEFAQDTILVARAHYSKRKSSWDH